jgi:uncharacterized protein (DUF58 family)
MILTGRVPLLLLAGLAPVVVWPRAWTVVGWIALVLAAWLVDRLLTASLGAVEVRRAPLAPVRFGSSVSSVLTLVAARRVDVVVRDAWQPTAGARSNRHRVRLAAGRPVEVTTVLTPVRRGDLLADGVTLRVHGPLGLAARQATREVPGSVRSLPPFTSRKHLPSRLARLRDLEGTTAVMVRGQGTEFDSLREYVRGDDVRSIDWRASSRSRSVVVRTWQPERDRRVVIVLDTSRTSAGRVDVDGVAMPRLDEGIEACLLLASLATRAGDRVDVLAGDQTVRARLRSAGDRAIAALIQDRLAGIQPSLVEADWTTVAGEIGRLGRQRALLVLLTPLEPAAVEESLVTVLPSLVAHHHVVLASVRDPALESLRAGRGGVEDAYAAAAAEHAIARRADTAGMLASLGVEVIDVDDLAPALADHYLLLKATGRL